MASALSAFNTCSSLRSFSLLNDRIFVLGRYMPPPPNLLLPCAPLASSSVAFSRRRNQNSFVASSSKKKKKTSLPAENENDDEEEGDDTDEDAFDALFDMLEGDLKNSDSSAVDEDDYDDMSEEDIEKLQRELEEALGSDGGEDEAYDMETDVSSPHEEEEREEGRPLKLRNWQIRRLASALKKGRRKISIKNLAGDLCLERAVVLDLLRDPPPSLVMLSAALPDEPEPSLPVQATPIESVTEEMTVEEDAVKDESKVNLPVHVMYHKWNARKRLKKVHVQTLERVYRRTKRPTNTMVSSIVHVTNLPRKRVVKWFEDKRTEEGVPEQRIPYRRSIHETVSSS